MLNFLCEWFKSVYIYFDLWKNLIINFKLFFLGVKDFWLINFNDMLFFWLIFGLFLI